MQLTGDDLLGEVQRVGAGDQREQPPLVHAVVEEQLLLGVRGRLELAAAYGVLRRDRQRDLARVDAGAAHADPALHEGAEHREEAAVGVVDLALVDTRGRDVGEPVEQRLARHPHAVEADPAVVDAVEPHLAAVVLDVDARAGLALLADRHDERVHALGRAADLELREDDRDLGVLRGVADVVLARLVAVRGDHELLGGHVVRRDRAERLDVGAVPGLGHREAAHQLPGDQVGEVGVVVALRAELQDRAAEEAELHADLHQHRQVAVRQRLERRDRGADVTAAAVLLGEAHPGLAGRRHLDDDLLHPLAEVVDGQVLGVLEDRGVLREVGADQVADLGVLPVEQRRERWYVDLGLDVAVRGRGRSGVGGHASTLPRRHAAQAVLWTGAASHPARSGTGVEVRGGPGVHGDLLDRDDRSAGPG